MQGFFFFQRETIVAILNILQDLYLKKKGLGTFHLKYNSKLIHYKDQKSSSNALLTFQCTEKRVEKLVLNHDD